MKKDCSTCLCREGSCYPSITIFDKDKTCRSYTPDYEGYIADLEESNANLKTEIKEKGRTIHTFQVDIGKLKNENVELKTVKIPQLERKIASIRGAHSVDCKKLNARTEQVERLKKENTELKENNKSYEKIIDNSSATLMKEKLKNYKQLTKAKGIILKLYNAGRDVLMCRAEEKAYDNLEEAINDRSIEQFLKEE